MGVFLRSFGVFFYGFGVVLPCFRGNLSLSEEFWGTRSDDVYPFGGFWVHILMMCTHWEGVCG